MSDVSADVGDGSPEVPHRARRVGGRRARALGLLDQPGREAGAVPGAVGGSDPRRGHLVRQHLHRVRGRLRRARAHPRGPRGQARGQSRPPGQPGQALLARPGRAAGALQSRAHPRRRWPAARTAASARSAGTTRSPASRPSSARPAASWRSSAAPAAGPSPSCSPTGPAPRAGALVRWEPFDHEPLRAANRQVFGIDQLPSHDFAQREVHPVVRRRLPRHLALADGAAARLRHVARLRRGRRGQVRLRRRRART